MAHPENALTHLLDVGPLIVAHLQAQIGGLAVRLVTDGAQAAELPCVVGAAADQPVALVYLLGMEPTSRVGVVQELGQDWRVELAVAGGPVAVAPLLDAVLSALQGWRPAKGVTPGLVRSVGRPRAVQMRALWPIDMRFGVTSYGTRV